MSTTLLFTAVLVALSLLITECADEVCLLQLPDAILSKRSISASQVLTDEAVVAHNDMASLMAMEVRTTLGSVAIVAIILVVITSLICLGCCLRPPVESSQSAVAKNSQESPPSSASSHWAEVHGALRTVARDTKQGVVHVAAAGGEATEEAMGKTMSGVLDTALTAGRAVVDSIVQDVVGMRETLGVAGFMMGSVEIGLSLVSPSVRIEFEFAEGADIKIMKAHEDDLTTLQSGIVVALRQKDNLDPLFAKIGATLAGFAIEVSGTGATAEISIGALSSISLDDLDTTKLSETESAVVATLQQQEAMIPTFGKMGMEFGKITVAVGWPPGVKMELGFIA
jgi:hypothetical protein